MLIQVLIKQVAIQNQHKNEQVSNVHNLQIVNGK
jgi:hypothetical protein